MEFLRRCSTRITPSSGTMSYRYSRFKITHHHSRPWRPLPFRTTSSSASPPLANSIENKDDPSLWVKSPLPDVTLLPGVTLHEIVWSTLWKGKDRESRTCIECGVTGRKYTYGQVYKYSRNFAGSLIRAGLKKGDRIGLVLPNIPEYPIALLGAWSAGLTISPVNPAYTPDEISRQLLNSEVNSVVTISHFLPAVQTAQQSLPGLKTLIVIGDSGEATDLGTHSFYSMAKEGSPDGLTLFTGANVDTKEDIAILPYSSGTTGPPKGVMLTHYNLTSCFRQFNVPAFVSSAEYDGVNEQERILGLLPFFHSYGFAALLIFAIYQGTHTLCLPKFDPVTYIAALRKHQPTTMHLVTPLISFMVNSPEIGRAELEHTHTIIASAAPIGASLITRLLDKAGRNIFFQEGYGMTELSPIGHIVPQSAGNKKTGSCGVPISNTLTKIIDTETGRTLGKEQKGELCIKGAQVMKGYYKNEEATKETIDSEGWLHTGDIAVYDSDGYCHIVDRVKELIKVKGFQVAPSELEALLREHPSVLDAAVIGIPDEMSGELPRAYVVPKPNAKVDELPELLQEYMKPKVTSYKQLKGGIEFVEVIPKAPSGKILRRELVRAFRESQEGKGKI